jgi:hypothetical protein
MPCRRSTREAREEEKKKKKKKKEEEEWKNSNGIVHLLSTALGLTLLQLST